MKWYYIEFEPFDDQISKHYLSFDMNDFILVKRRLAKLFPQKAIDNDEKLKLYLKGKKYRLIEPQKIYDVLKYRC